MKHTGEEWKRLISPKRSRDLINELGTRSQEIGQIVDLIGGIAEQD
jgi:methyl-accepting chemotaxis protein